MKIILFIFLSFFLAELTYSQILRNVPLNLNAGGEVFDAVYIPAIKRYLLVGNFTSVNGIGRIKHAFLKNDGTLDASLTLGITSIGGTDTPSGHLYTTAIIGNSIYIGGDISSLNSVPKTGLIRYIVSGTEFSPILTQSTTNIPNFPLGTRIYDLENTVTNSLCAVGNFQSFLNLANNITYDNILEFSISGAISAKFGNNNSTGIGSIYVDPIDLPQILYHNSQYYITTTDSYGYKYSSAGNFLFEYGRGGFAGNDKSKNFAVLNDTSMIGSQSIGGSGSGYGTFFIPTNYATSSSISYPLVFRSGCLATGIEGGMGTVSYNGSVLEVLMNSNSSFNLNRYLFSFIQTPINVSQSVTNLQLNSFFCQTFNTNAVNFDNNNSKHLIRSRNKLFLSSPKITGAASITSQGLLQFCLEPENPKPFLTNQTIASIDINGQLTGEDLVYNPDSVLCPGQIKHYEIPASIGASGYKWKYTGTGLKYSFSQPFAGAPVSFFNTLNDSILSLATNANQIWIYVDANYSIGQFSVTPYDTCNFASQYLWAKPKVINFSDLPLPNIQVADSLFFTCASDNILLQASSTTANVSYAWIYQNNVISNSPNHTIFGSTNPPNPSLTIGNYVIRVKENSTGCISLDTVVVKDTFVVEPITIANFPSLFFCSTDSMILNAIAPNSTLSWFIANDTFNILTNPLTIYDTSFLQFTAKGIHNVSSCVTYQNFDLFPFIDQDPISGKLSSHPNYPGDIIIDTISCLNSLINVVCVPDPSNPNAGVSSAQWIINGSNAGNALNLTPADSMGMNLLQTKVYSFQTENGYNGCLDTFNAVVLFQLEKPFVDIYLGPSTTNCSFDTLTLSHPPTLGTTLSQGWLNGNTNTFLLDTLVQNSGSFVFEVIDNSNGCVNYDTVVVSQTLEMVLLGTPDTLVCPDLPFSVTVQPQNVFDPVIYNWSNGSTTNSSTGIGGVDTLLTVTGTSSAGCVGMDTVLISISEPIVASFQGFTQCGSPNGSIQVLTTAGGTGDYSYSMDNVNFTDSTNFGNLPMDSTYTFFIQDSIGCVYDFQTTLDATAQSPSMDFLMQTYNVVGDTIVAVNISAFQGFDSIAWFLPSSFDVLSVDDSMLVFHVSDTGNFEITMVGYQDTCAFEFSKFLRVDFFKPEFSDLTDTLGITSFLLSPNPTTGTFGVDVSFGKIQNFSIVVLTNLGQTIPGLSYSGNGNAINLPFTFPLGIAPGNYRVRVICEYDTQQQSIVKQ